MTTLLEHAGNPKHEIRDKFEIRNPKVARPFHLLDFAIWIGFGFRASDFVLPWFACGFLGQEIAMREYLRSGLSVVVTVLASLPW
jgi:hypothetical protein